MATAIAAPPSPSPWGRGTTARATSRTAVRPPTATRTRSAASCSRRSAAEIVATGLLGVRRRWSGGREVSGFPSARPSVCPGARSVEEKDCLSRGRPLRAPVSRRGVCPSAGHACGRASGVGAIPRGVCASAGRPYVWSIQQEETTMGEWTDKAKGKVKETVGVATGDRELEAEGKADTLKGKVKEGIEDAKRAIKDKVEDLKGRKREDPDAI